MELNWIELENEEGNEYWEACSPYTNEDTPIMWRLRQEDIGICNKCLVWYEDHDGELMDNKGFFFLFWSSLSQAKEAIQRDNDRIIEDLKKENGI